MSPTAEILFSTGDGTAAWINPDDLTDLQALIERSADFIELVEGTPPSPHGAEELAAESPPGWGLDKKILIGVYDPEGQMVAVIEGIRDYPEAGVYWIGLMLIDPDHRNQGLGERMLRGFEDWARGQGAHQIGLGVVESNQKAYRFWQRVGFALKDITGPVQMGNKEQRIYRMRKSIEKRIRCKPLRKQNSRY